MNMNERARSLWDLNIKETEIAHLVANGYSNPEIGDYLELSTQTIKWYMRGIFVKMSVHNRVLVARKWILEVEK